MALRDGRVARAAGAALLSLGLLLAALPAPAQEPRLVPIEPMEGEATPSADAPDVAAGEGAAAGGIVEVGVRHSPPFAMVHGDGRFTGLAVDLFRLAAEDIGFAYRLSAAEGERPAAGSIVLPVKATAELEAVADVTHPVYTATLGVVRPQGRLLLDVVRGLMSPDFLRLVLGLSLLLLVVGAAVWVIERKRNDMFATRPLHGLGDGFWWAGVTLTTIGYGDKAPITFWGRALAMLWMLVGLAVSAALTAAIVTLSGANNVVLPLPEELRDKRVVTLEGGMAEPFLAREGIEPQRVATMEEALERLRSGEADRVLGGTPRLEWALGQDSELRVRSTRLHPVLIGFAVAQDDPILEPLNAALLSLLATEAGQETVRRYLPDG